MSIQPKPWTDGSDSSDSSSEPEEESEEEFDEEGEWEEEEEEPIDINQSTEYLMGLQELADIEERDERWYGMIREVFNESYRNLMLS